MPSWRDDVTRWRRIHAEEASPLNAEIVKLVCGVDELAHHSLLPDVGAPDWPKLAFSAKEAFYKLDNPITGGGVRFPRCFVLVLCQLRPLWRRVCNRDEQRPDRPIRAATFGSGPGVATIDGSMPALRC